MLKQSSRKMISRLIIAIYLFVGAVVYAAALLAPQDLRPYIRMALIIYCILAPVIGFTSYLIKKSG